MRSYKVSEINSYINKLLSTDFMLSDIEIKGEISNFTHHYSGHMYFTLKDETSRLRSVMFRSDNKKLNIVPKTGMKVVVRGNISVYEKDGIYQLYVKEMEEDGRGNLYEEFLKLKDKLEKEGLFKPENKKDLPSMPKKIGVVTSASGAAVRDIITVVKRRFPPTEILIYPSLVQGEQAAASIIEGLKFLDAKEDIDLIIFGRGGGSIEELFAFNDEDLARTIYEMDTPTISAVGHEVDYTIADFVADLRAATPSAAAELSVANIFDYKKELEYNKGLIEDKILAKVIQEKRNLEYLKKGIRAYNPIHKIYKDTQALDMIYDRIESNLRLYLSNQMISLSAIKDSLKSLDPRIGLDMGYTIALDSQDRPINSVEDLDIDDMINICFKDGCIESQVKFIKKVGCDEY